MSGKLTRVIVVVAAIGATVLCTAASCGDVLGGSANCNGTQTVTVHKGDTVNQIVDRNVSGSFASGPVILKVETDNGLKGDAIRPGQRLELPASCS